MVTKILFDERSVYYDKYAIFRNQYVVKKLCKDFVEEVNKRGYFYLNQAYEFFGIPWDTGDRPAAVGFLPAVCPAELLPVLRRRVAKRAAGAAG